MSVFQLLIILSALFAFVQLLRIEQKGAKWITVAVAVTAILSVLPWPIVSYDGFVAHIIALFVALIFLFSPRSDEPTTEQKIVSTIIIVFPMLTMLFQFLSPQQGGIPTMQIACIVSVGALVYALVKKKSDYSNEIGILAVAAMNAFVQFSSGVLLLLDV